MGTLSRDVFEQQKQFALAPDGLPWPPGYFDRMPRETFEDALKNYGVRPNHYKWGWPIYTEAETKRPEFINTIPPESPELEAEWRADWVAWKRLHPENDPSTAQISRIGSACEFHSAGSFSASRTGSNYFEARPEMVPKSELLVTA